MTLVVGLLTLHLHLPESQSLKEKRMVLKSLKDTLRRQFNVSIGEVNGHDTWQRAVLGIASVGNDRRYVNGQLSQVLEWAGQQRSAAVTDYTLEWW